MFSPKCRFSFIVLAFLCGNASPAHSGITKMQATHAPRANHADSLYETQLGKRDDTVFVEKDAVGYYCAYIVTSSTSTYKVAVDTGSAYSWVGAQEHNPYVQGSASVDLGVTTSAAYADAKIRFNGRPIGVPIQLVAFPAGIDGILGLGPTRLNDGLRSDGEIIPTVVDSLYAQGAISSPSLGIYFTPENVGKSGLLSFGYVRDSVLTSPVSYVPVTGTYPASRGWGIDASIVYGNTLPLIPSGAGTLDTGSATISLPGAAFQMYMWGTRGVLHVQSGLVYLNQAKYAALQPLFIAIGDQTYDLSPNAQILPRSSPNTGIWLAFQQMGPLTGTAFTFGMPFFQRYYVVFNSSTNAIGFARHLYTDSTTN
ncbi:hypothetical protein ID866_9138 [Astraeus odoratus]|nr:hypothetical protein ID866_9138 [Astraeus odoratus]